ncbi:MAG: DUF4363 family protein [Clostridia bacterium]|nr:DUF4363 family protein [Clostridia bacterium]
MRTSVLIALTLLAVVILGGVLTEDAMRRVSDMYVAAAEELRTLVTAQQWPRAEETAAIYQADWEKRVPALQMLINHDDTDDVTMALALLRASIEARDIPGCLQACAQLRENALHLHHRDAFTLANVL